MEMKVNRFPKRCCAASFFAMGAVAAILSTASGCGNKQFSTVPVEGVVRYQGKPLKFGAVVFQPDVGPPALGRIEPDGTFRLTSYGDKPGAILGVHRVAISCYERDAPLPPGVPPRTEKMGPGKQLIPPRYFSPQTSRIQVEVKSQNKPFEFDLKD
jgi:hypothetical protein